MPPTLNSTVEGRSARAQNLSSLYPCRLWPPFFHSAWLVLPQFPGGSCQYVPAHLQGPGKSQVGSLPLARYSTLTQVSPDFGFSRHSSEMLMSPTSPIKPALGEK